MKLDIRADLNVNGVVNSNGSEACSYRHNKFMNGKVLNNHVHAKITADGKDFTSSACLRKALFATSDNYFASDDKNLQDEFAGSAEGLLRGYMFTNSKCEAIKRKSCVTVLNAVSEDDKVITSVCSKSGEREKNSFFSKDDAGERIQKFRAIVDTDMLKIIRHNERDGLSFNCTMEQFKAILDRNFGLGGEACDIKDGVIELRDEVVSRLVKYFVQRLKDIGIFKAGASLECNTDSVQIVNYKTKELLEL